MMPTPARLQAETAGRAAAAAGWLDDLPLAALLIDRKGMLVAANSQAQEAFGLRPGGDFCALFSHASAARLARVAGGEDEGPLILRDEPFGDGLKSVDVWVRGLGAEPGEAAALALIDESPARARARAENLLAVADQTAEGLVAALAHELRHPLASLKGAAQLLARGVAPARARTLAAVIGEEIARLDRLVQQVADFADSGGALAPVNLHEVLDHALTLTELRARKEGPAKLVITRDYDPSLPEITGQRDALVQLFLNLLENAREALREREEPRILLRSRFVQGLGREDERPRDAGIAVTIEDNGPGIGLEAADDLFAAYVSSRGKRRGLGLAIAARIVRRHKGLIRHDGSSLGGAAFTVILPLHREDKR